MSNIIKGQRVRSESTLSLVSVQADVIVPNYDDLESKPSVQEEVDKEIAHLIKRAEQEANIIIEQAKAKAEQIVIKKQQEADKEKLVVLDKARQDGYKEGYDKGQLEAQNLIEQAKVVLEDAYTEKEQVIEQAEPEMIELIISICRKILDQEILFNPDIIKVLIKKALNELQYDTSGITIKVPVDQYDYVIENKLEILENYNDPDGIEIWKDPTLQCGTCVVETPFGSVECNVKNQFAELKKQMRLIASNR